MKNNLDDLIKDGTINIPTDCIFCFGTGFMYPNELGVHPCVNEDCIRTEYFFGGYSEHRQVLCCTGIVWNIYYDEEFDEKIPNGIDHLEVFARVAWVDVGLYPVINDLWDSEIDTFTSCQGGLYDEEAEIQDAYVALVLIDDNKIDIARSIISKYGVITSEEDYREDNESFSDYVFRWLWK